MGLIVCNKILRLGTRSRRFRVQQNLTGMGHFMPPIVGVIGESTVAIPTLVRLFSGVSSHVIAQVKFRFEHFRANLLTRIKTALFEIQMNT